MGGSSIAGLALVLLLLASSAAASQPVTGFAAYEVHIASPGGQRSALVNETVAPTSKAGYSDLILQLTGGQQNLTYSRLVNATEDLFPYLPVLATQSLRYSNGTEYSIDVNLTATGATTVSFQGSQYTLSVFSVSILASYGNRSINTNATVRTFPSALVYSLSAGNSTVGVQAVLQATNLPLVSSPPSEATAAYVGAGVGIGAVALAGGFLMRRRERRTPVKEEKPLHWVD